MVGRVDVALTSDMATASHHGQQAPQHRPVVLLRRPHCVQVEGLCGGCTMKMALGALRC